jgi:hypothetical protein
VEAGLKSIDASQRTQVDAQLEPLLKQARIRIDRAANCA